MSQKYSFPGTCPIFYGEHAVEDLPAQLAAMTDKSRPVIVISDKGIEAAGVVGKVLEVLQSANRMVHTFLEIQSNPSAASIDAAANAIRELDGPCVVGLGGGSVMDVTKLAAVVAAGSESVSHYGLCKNPLPKSEIKTVLIPTTAGTGSETTRTCIFSDADHKKIWAWGDELMADLVLIDASLTTKLPWHLTAATGLDAMVHAIEACTAQSHQLLTDQLALRAITLVKEYLPVLKENPEDLDARLNMLLAACLAGVAIDSCGTGVAHGIGHALGNIKNLHHGVAVTIGLKATLEWCEAGAPDKYHGVRAALDLSEQQSVGSWFNQFCHRLELGFDKLDDDITVDALIDEMRREENIPMLKNNSRPVISDEDVQAVARLTLEL